MTDLLWNKNIMQQSYFDWFVYETFVPKVKTTVARQLEWIAGGSKETEVEVCQTMDNCRQKSQRWGLGYVAGS